MEQSEREKKESRPVFGFEEKKPTLDLGAIDIEMLLLAEAADGEIHVIEADSGEWVRVGRKDFTDKSDRAVAALGLESLERLIHYGWVAHRSGQLYVLTGAGWRNARAIRDSVAQRG